MLEVKNDFFNLPEEKAEVRVNLEKKANELGLLINPYMDYKIKWSELHGGRCMCDWKHRKCPCDDLSKDLTEYNGECLCKVLVTEEKMKKIEKLKKRKGKSKRKKKAVTKEQVKKDNAKVEEAKALAEKLGCKNKK